MWVAVFLLEAAIAIGIFAAVLISDVPATLFSSESKLSFFGCFLDLDTLDFLTLFLSALEDVVIGILADVLASEVLKEGTFRRPD